MNTSDDKRSQAVAMREMGVVAWPTIGFGVVVISGYAALSVVLALGLIPLWLAFFLGAALVYANYTVMHEAVHGSITGKNRRLFWLNEALGYLAGQVLAVPFTGHRKEHIDHHRYTNMHDKDPDLVLVAGGLCTVLIGVFRGIPHQFQHYFARHWSHASQRDRITLITEGAVAISWRLAFGFWVGWDIGLIYLLGASALGGFVTLVFFAWIVHLPHARVGRFKDTTTFTFPGVWDDVVTGLWLFQNYHAIHHLYPRIPFYRYRAVFRQIRGHMEENDAHLVDVGRRA